MYKEVLKLFKVSEVAMKSLSYKLHDLKGDIEKSH